MTIEWMTAGSIAVALLGYLLYSLLWPERF